MLLVSSKYLHSSFSCFFRPFRSLIQTKLIYLKQKTDLFTVMQMKYHQYPQENINILFRSVFSWMDKMDLVCLEATFPFYVAASYRWVFLVQSLAVAALLFLLFHNYSFCTWPHTSCYYTLSTFCSFSPQAKKILTFPCISVGSQLCIITKFH